MNFIKFNFKILNSKFKIQNTPWFIILILVIVLVRNLVFNCRLSLLPFNPFRPVGLRVINFYMDSDSLNSGLMFTKNKEQRTKNKKQITKNKEQKTKNKEQKTKNKGG